MHAANAAGELIVGAVFVRDGALEMDAVSRGFASGFDLGFAIMVGGGERLADYALFRAQNVLLKRIAIELEKPRQKRLRVRLPTTLRIGSSESMERDWRQERAAVAFRWRGVELACRAAAWR